MNVGHIVLGLDPGGAEQLVLGLVRNTSEFSCTVAVVDPRRTGWTHRLDGSGVDLEIGPTLGARTLGWIRRVIGDHDIVHTHAPSVGSLVRLVRLSLRPEDRPYLIHTEHNLWQSHRPFTRLLNAASIGQVDSLVAVSSAVASSMRAQQSVLVHHHGIDVRAISDAVQTVDRQSKRQSLDIPENRIVLLTVANPRPQKAYDVLIRAVSRPEVLEHDPVLLAVGDGPDLNRLRRNVAEQGLEGRVRFLGARSDVPELLAVADIFVLASHTEGRPVALMEASAAALPIIATDVGGVSSIVLDGQTGLLVERHDVAGLARKLVYLVEEPTIRADLAAGARRVATEFDVGVSARWYERLYSRLVESS